MAEEQLSKNVYSLVNESNLHNIEDASLMFSFKSWLGQTGYHGNNQMLVSTAIALN